MTTKVLVFESDAAFAGELRNELGKLDCNTLVVDDGNVGLQQAASERPDLILLSIELPRMNGFSVCNKLKKDPALKDVPLIIMSSESSEETFEQHRKLRTRAEDYVHKPIAFGELLRHIQAFVPLGADVRPSLMPNSSDGVIVIDDDLQVPAVHDYAEDDQAMTQIARRPDFPLTRPRSAAPIDKDVEDFADNAFDALQGPSASAPVEVRNGAGFASAPPPPPPLADVVARDDAPAGPPPLPPQMPPLPPQAPQRQPSAPSITRHPSQPPRAAIDPAEHERLRADLEKAKARSSEMERDLGAAKADIARLQSDSSRQSKSDAESQRMQREIDELKAKLASPTKAAGGGISSRDFLDLREALNKKDKEILALREGLTKKDKEQIDSQDKLLVLERGKADFEDKVIAAEREITDAREKIEALTADKDLAKKAGEDLRVRLERSKADTEAKAKELTDLKAKHAEDLAAQDQAKAKLKADLEQVLTGEREAHERALEGAEATRKSDLEQAGRDREAALAEAAEQATREKAEAIAAREAELKAESDGKLAALHRAHQQEVETERRAAAERLDAREHDLDGQRTEALAAAERTHDARVEALEKDHAERVAAVENDRDSRLVGLEARAARELADVKAEAETQRTAAEEQRVKLEADLASVRAELTALEQAKRAAEAEAAANLAEQRAAAARAKDQADRDLSTARDRGSLLEAELAAMKQDLSETRQKLANESSRADRAFAKWESDKGSLDRAKDALAVALSQIEEAEARAIAG